MRLVRVAMKSFPGRAGDPWLLRVELDDERFLHRRVDLLTTRRAQHLPGEPLVVGLKPTGDRGGEIGRIADDLPRGRGRDDGDDVLGLDLVARDVDPAAVHLEVTVPDELPGLGPRGGEAEAGHDVVEPRLEDAQQVLAGDPGLARSLLVVQTELVLEHAVVAAGLLLLAQLEQVLALLDPTTAVLARRIAAALDGALLGEAALALEEELDPLAAALLALG